MTSLMIPLLVLGLFPQPLQAAEMQVVFLRPSSLEPVLGEAEVEVHVDAPERVTVDLFVDGARVGSRTSPPYVWRVDVGSRNAGHAFEAVVVGRSGMTETASLTTPPIRIDEQLDVSLRQLYVTVSHDRRRVLDLGQDDFRILDGGTPQRLVTFARGEVPITAMLLLDASESMRGPRFAAALRGAEAFVAGMRELDEAKLVLFSDQVLRVTPFTNRPASLLGPLQGAAAEGNTSINDHLYLALRMCDARQGRRVVVLFTDGADLHSVLDMDDVLWSARRSQALIYWLRLEDGGGRDFATAWRDPAANRAQREALDEAVIQSGGRITELTDPADVEDAFRDILAELREQYVLGYYPSVDRDDGSWRTVDVKVKRPGIRVRTRGGYVDN